MSQIFLAKLNGIHVTKSTYGNVLNPLNRSSSHSLKARFSKSSFREFSSSRNVKEDSRFENSPLNIDFRPSRTRNIRIHSNHTSGQQILRESLQLGLESTQKDKKSSNSTISFDDCRDSFGKIEDIGLNRDSVPFSLHNNIGFPPKNEIRGRNQRDEEVEEEDEHLESLSQEEKELFKRQKNFEEEAITSAAARYMEMVEELTKLGKATNLKSIEKILVKWFQPISEAIKKEQQPPSRSNWSPKVMSEGTLSCLSSEKLAVIALHTVLGQSLVKPTDLTVTSVILQIADACMAEVSLQILKDGGHNQYLKFFTQSVSNIRKINLNTRQMTQLDWNPKVKSHLGAILLDKVIDYAILEDGTPAFTKFTKITEKKKTNFVVPSPQLLELINDTHEYSLNFLQAKHFPMVVKPRPWSTCKTGGYLTVSHPIIRLKDSKRQLDEIDAIEQMEPSYLKPLYSAINSLAETPWKINRDMSRIIDEAWEKGETIGDMPSRTDFPLPDKPPANSDPSEIQKYKRSLAKTTQLNADLHSLRSSLQYQLRTATKFEDDTVYFPHNMDFRGRTYPIPPHLNHLGNDMCRSLLVFAEKKKIGVEGMKWMKIHMSNLFGFDKAPFDERAAFIEENIEKVYDCADSPLDGSRWWLKAEKPWQFLANCIEFTKAMRSENPYEFETGVPVHQDGTCNGLQHYAALGGDVLGATQVNLAPSDRPQDVYSGVADIVRRRVKEDAENGDPLAQVLQNQITRKIVKQTVMTSVYGVTFVGASRQIASQLKDLHLFAEDWDEYKAAAYLAKHTFASLGEIFLGAQTLMDWLAICAKKIAAEDGKDVSWTTPLGLKVIQPYRKEKSTETHVTTVLQSISLKPASGMKVSVSKQKAAFPPNYIHSLDSTHMLYTAQKMKDKGLTFASVHDSYWTHASSVPDMNRILREQFIRLHKQPLLQNLAKEFHKNHPKIEFPELPPRGEFDINEVQQSSYFFN
eukprot:TRINITY_DN11393_c0_g1_i1.p1 TRINITY_DN11393_c0_g1~~TRINITY_DN11393_c0_g1_i1.p1  ORF type:complete len:974 (-),score=286.13 TRINITY_DN11393_c0_g1_i1:23-2944(-)